MAPCTPVLILDTPTPGPTATNNQAPSLPSLARQSQRSLPPRGVRHIAAPRPQAGPLPGGAGTPGNSDPNSFPLKRRGDSGASDPAPQQTIPLRSAGSLAATAALAPPPPAATRRSILVDFVTI